MSAANTPNLVPIWPAPGKETLAQQMGAIARNGSFFVDPNRTDENAKKLKRMFGSEAARRIREAAAIAAAQPAKETERVAAPTAQEPASPAQPRGKLSLKAAAPVKQDAESAETDASAFFDQVLATAGGGGVKGPAITWIDGVLDRPQTAARTGMRGVVTSASIADANAGGKTMKLVIDYRGFMIENAAIAEAVGTKAPGSFETVPLTVTPAEGEPMAALAAKLNRTFKQVDAPTTEIAPGMKTAAEARKSDERLLMAQAANAEVARRGETPPAPIPPVNDSPNATRVYFWAAREKDDSYYYKTLLAALTEANIPYITDRDSGSPHWGLRYAEVTQAEVALWPASVTRFLTEAAHQAHLASKGKKESSKNLVAGAAATAALEVTTRRETAAKPASVPTEGKSQPETPAPQPDASKTPSAPAMAQPAAPAAETAATPVAKPATEDTDKGQLYPLTVPHPDRDRDGWFRARAAIFNIEPGKLVQLIDLTSKMHEELEIKKDMKRTIGEDVDADDMTRLSTWWHGINLGKEALRRRGITYQGPDKRAEQLPEINTAPARQAEATRQHDRQAAQIER